MTVVLGLNWDIGNNSGWGLCGLHIALRALETGRAHPLPMGGVTDGLPEHQRQALAPALEPGRAMATAIRDARGQVVSVDFPVLQGVGNGMVWLDRVRGRVEYGMITIEDTSIDGPARDRANGFERIITSSRWNRDILLASGVKEARLCYQGVDTEVFRRGPGTGRFEGRFVVFSGGKLEYRKGQDIVLAAFRTFRERHPEALLVSAWHNLWPKMAASVAASDLVEAAPEVGADGLLEIGAWAARHGVPQLAFVSLDLAPYGTHAPVLRDADVALFTSRCECATNLVAMECIASGVPTILSANSGHRDLIELTGCRALTRQLPVSPGTAGSGTLGWGESSVEEAVESLEYVYENREEAREHGLAAAGAIESRTWTGWGDSVLTALLD